MICSNCNITDNTLDAVFCYNCGYQLKKEKKSNGWAIFFAILFVVAGILAIYFYSELESQRYRISSLEYENSKFESDNNNIRNEYHKKEGEIQALTYINNTQKSEIEKMKPQRYKTKYNNQILYFYCDNNWQQLNCSFQDKGSSVDVYWQRDGFGLTYWGYWIPMNRLEK